MKKVYFATDNNDSRINTGTILNVCDIEDNYTLNPSFKCGMDSLEFDEIAIPIKDLRIVKDGDSWTAIKHNSEDEVNTLLERARIHWEEKCLEGGNKAKARFNRMLRKYGYGLPEQSYFMASEDFRTIDYLLSHGAIDQTIALLDAKTEEGAYTTEFKNEFMAILNEISNEIGNEPGV